MARITQAHHRRNRTLLEWISAEKAESEVVWGSERVGTWEEIQPRWRESNQRIRFKFRARNRNVTAWIVCLQPTPWGIKVLLRDFDKAFPNELRVVWPNASFEGTPARANDFWKTIRPWVRVHWPGCTIVSATQRADRTHTISGAFLRVQVRYRGRVYLLIGCGAAPVETTNEMLAQGLLWVACLQKIRQLDGLPTLCLMVPAGHSGILYHRARYLNPERIKVEIWEHEDSAEQGSFHPAPPPPPPEENRDFRWPLLGPFRWSALLARVLDLAPNLIRRYPRFQDYDSLRLCGLEFARVFGEERDRVSFGIGAHQSELTDETFAELRSLVEEILFFRRPDTPDTHHPYYTLQSERWLESLILEEVSRIFPELAPETVYSQIPVYLGKDPGRVDILGADLQGTLVVMELKVLEDPNLPVQALDYWGRVIQHNICGDFERRGYFSGIQLNRRQPRIYVVAPVFSFHDSTERVLRFFDPGLEVWKIAINHDWRSGVRILRRTSLCCGELP
jgi:hypothetical protein